MMNNIIITKEKRKNIYNRPEMLTAICREKILGKMNPFSRQSASDSKTCAQRQGERSLDLNRQVDFYIIQMRT